MWFKAYARVVDHCCVPGWAMMWWSGQHAGKIDTRPHCAHRSAAPPTTAQTRVTWPQPTNHRPPPPRPTSDAQTAKTSNTFILTPQLLAQESRIDGLRVKLVKWCVTSSNTSNQGSNWIENFLRLVLPEPKYYSYTSWQRLVSYHIYYLYNRYVSQFLCKGTSDVLSWIKINAPSGKRLEPRAVMWNNWVTQTHKTGRLHSSLGVSKHYQTRHCTLLSSRGALQCCSALSKPAQIQKTGESWAGDVKLLLNISNCLILRCGYGELHFKLKLDFYEKITTNTRSISLLFWPKIAAISIFILGLILLSSLLQSLHDHF